MVSPTGPVSADGPALVAAVYWRRNPFLAAMMQPWVCTLAGGRFAAIGPDGAPVFDVPAGSVQGDLGRIGTFKFRADGRKYAVVGRGSLGGSEKGHTEAQRRYVHDFLQAHPQAADARPGHAGLIDTVFNQAATAKLEVWRDALNAAGASIS